MYIPTRRHSLASRALGGAGAGDGGSESVSTANFFFESEGKDLLGQKNKTSHVDRMAQAVEASTRDAVELVASTGGLKSDAARVDRETLKRVVVSHHVQLYGCLALPFSLAFFLAFAASAYLHEDITQVFLIESGLREQIGGGLDEIESIQEVWNWINGSLVPKIFQQTDWEGEPLEDKARWNRVLLYNQLQGPLVLEQLRGERVRCSGWGELADHMVCYPKESRSAAQFGGMST
mmetsp:Transcript_58408/g.164956  ORF Transcript_58408/g.164956 Transcript_58408/m.164956 type:complete len:235 (-) Transcript_58408:3-707(-)